MSSRKKLVVFAYVLIAIIAWCIIKVIFFMQPTPIVEGEAYVVPAPPAVEEPIDPLIVRYSQYLGEDLSAYVFYTAKAFNVEPEIVYNIIEAESTFNPNAVNGKFTGLMQVSTSNLPYIESCFERKFNLLDPYDNVLAGVFWFSGIQENNNGSTDKDLMVYNLGGPSAKAMWDSGVTSTPYSRGITRTL